MSYVKQRTYDGDQLHWIPIECWNYWDFARTFSLRFDEKLLVFHSPFLEFSDEYSDSFIVYTADDTLNDLKHNFLKLPIVDVIPVDEIVMDESRKNYVVREPLLRRWKSKQV